MKKLIYILVALFTFSIGFWIFHFSFDKKTSLTSTDKLISLCEISQNPQGYEHKKIQIRAFIESGGYSDMPLGIHVSDFREGCVIGANLQLSESKQDENIKISEQFKRDEKFTNLLHKLNEKRHEPAYIGRDGWSIVEVEIVGELKIINDDKINGGQVIELNPTEIKPISSINFVRASEMRNFQRI